MATYKVIRCSPLGEERTFDVDDQPGGRIHTHVAAAKQAATLAAELGWETDRYQVKRVADSRGFERQPEDEIEETT